MPSWVSTSASVVPAPLTIPVSFVVATSSPFGPLVTSSDMNGSRRFLGSYWLPPASGTAGAETRGPAAGVAAGGGVGATAGAAPTGLTAAAGGGGGDPPHAVSTAQRLPRPASAIARLTSDSLPTSATRPPAWAAWSARRYGPGARPGTSDTCTSRA